MNSRKLYAPMVEAKESVSNHFKRHKTLYLTGGVAIVAVVGTTLYFKKIVIPREIDTHVSASIKNIVIGNHNTVHNTQYTKVIRRGHPGFVVRCVETGELFASQNRAADLLGLDRTALSKHLNGKTEHLNGLHFERVGLAQ